MSSEITSVPMGRVSMVFPEGTKFLDDCRAHLDMALQPIVDAQSGAPIGYEALMRGFVAVGCKSIKDVLNTAYRHTVLSELDLILREKAITKFASLPDCSGKMLFYNFDGRVLERPEALHAQTEMLLKKNNIPSSSVCIEFAETFKTAMPENINGMLKAYRKDGVRFAIDDFGKGFSELTALYEYEPDFIKVDGFFIKGINEDSRKRLFVSTVVNLAHVLGVSVVAEGVETEDEYAVCRDIGCNFIQGFFIARPMKDISSLPTFYPQISHSRYAKRRDDLSEGGLVRERLEELAALRVDMDLPKVIEEFRYSGDKTFFPVVDKEGRPKGIINETALKKLIYLPAGETPDFGDAKDVSSFVEKCPIADIHQDVDKVLDIFTYNQNAEGIIITEDSKYIGFLSTLALLEIMNEKRLEKATDQNPLSLLPGNSSITDFVAQCADKTEENRFLCYFDFDHFKPFNDYYGFREGDRAIILFAELMRAQLPESGYMLGHIGGDDFFAGLQGRDMEEFVERMQNLQRTYARNVESFYSAKHRAKGYLETKDRYGETRRFPLLTCSAAILGIPAGVEVSCPESLLRQVSKLKSEAKKAEDGMAMMCYLGDGIQPKTERSDIEELFSKAAA